MVRIDSISFGIMFRIGCIGVGSIIGFGSILSVSDRFYRFPIDSIGFGSILSVSDRFYRVSDRFYRFRIDSIGFGLILSVLD